MDTWLDKLLEHDAAYAGMAADCEKTSIAWYLSAPTLPYYQDANRAIRLRDDGRGPQIVANEVAAYFQARNMKVVVDLDPISEQQGIGAAIRKIGLMPAMTDRILMRYASTAPPIGSASGILIKQFPTNPEAAKQGNG